MTGIMDRFKEERQLVGLWQEELGLEKDACVAARKNSDSKIVADHEQKVDETLVLMSVFCALDDFCSELAQAPKRELPDRESLCEVLAGKVNRSSKGDVPFVTGNDVFRILEEVMNKCRK